MLNPSPQQYAKWCRKTFLTHLEKECGELVLRGLWILAKDKRIILACYSKLLEIKFWYGVGQHDWQKWESDSCLAFLMRDGEELSYVLLNPKESQELLDKINPATTGSKNINIYMGPGKLYIQEWPDFPFAGRIVKIGPIIKSGSFRPLSPEVQAALKNKSPEEITELLAKIPEREK